MLTKQEIMTMDPESVAEHFEQNVTEMDAPDGYNVDMPCGCTVFYSHRDGGPACPQIIRYGIPLNTANTCPIHGVTSPP